MRAIFLVVMILSALVVPATWSGCGDGSGSGDGDFSVDAYPTLTNQSPYSFSGQKPEGHAVHVDGSEMVAAGPDTTWELSLALSEGDNSFTFESVDAGGTVADSEMVEITLDSIAPTVLSQVPAPGATGVVLNTSVLVTMSEPLDCSTVSSQNFLIQGVSADLQCTPDNPALSLTPQADLAPGTTYTVSLFSEVADPAGNQMDGDVGWQFTTGSTIDDTPPDPPTADNPPPPGTTVLDGATVGGWKEAGSSVISNGTEIVPKDDLDSWSYHFSFVLGENNFSLTSEDAAGNLSVTSTDFSVTRNPGEFTLDDYPPAVVQTPFNFTGTKSAGYSVWVNGAQEVPPGPETTWQHAADLSLGPNSFLFEACDQSGATVGSITADITLNSPSPAKLIIEFDLVDLWDYIGDEMYYRAVDRPEGPELNHYGIDIWVEGPYLSSENCIFDAAAKQRVDTRYVATVMHGVDHHCNPAAPNPPCSGWWNLSNYRAPNYLAALIEFGQWLNPTDPETGGHHPAPVDVVRRNPATGEQWPALMSGNQVTHPELYYAWLTPYNNWITRMKMIQQPYVDGLTEPTVDSGQDPVTGPPLGQWSITRTYEWDLTDHAGMPVDPGNYLINILPTVDRARKANGDIYLHFAHFLQMDRETCWDDPAHDDMGPHRAEGMISIDGATVQTLYLKEKGLPEYVDACAISNTHQYYGVGLITCDCGSSTTWPCPETPVDPNLIGERIYFMNPDKYLDPIGDGQNYAVKITYCPAGSDCP